MEWLEHKTGGKTQEAIRHAGAAGPIVGAFLGVVPQCGFSAVAATLYAGRVITLGTLFAVFLSISDEMLPIFLAEAVPGNTILSIMGAKVVIGMVKMCIRDRVTTASGLFLASDAKEKPQTGTIIAVGEGKMDKDGKLLPMPIKVGDKVIYGKFGGTEVTLDGENVLILRADDIYAVVE